MKGMNTFIVVFLAVLVTVTNGALVKVTDDNWGMISEGEWMLKFYAPWCPACKAIAPIWSTFASEDKRLGIGVGDVDVSSSPGLSGRFMVTSLPTIYHVRNGEFRVYTGSRSKDDFERYIADERYTELEPIAAWKSPNSILMSAVSLMFRLSMKVRSFHLVMTTEYGFPAWSVYGFFAVCTVIMGLLLGMVLVFITDCICPTRQPQRPMDGSPPPASIEEEEEEEEEEPADVTKKDEEEEEEEARKEAEAGTEEPIPPADEEAEGTGDTLLRKRKTETEVAEDN